MKRTLVILFLCIVHFKSFSQNKYMDSELDPNRLNMNFRVYDPNTALLMGQLSDLVYEDSLLIDNYMQILRKRYPDWKISYKFLNNKKSDAQALLFCTKNFMIIAFRGTEPNIVADWITDASFWNYENNPSFGNALSGMPAGHGGFRRSLINLIQEEDLFSEIDLLSQKMHPELKRSQFPIYTTGHSLGAALSQLFMECLRFEGYNFKGAYHFAPPLAVSCSLREQMKFNFGSIVYDIVNYKDYVPRAGRNGVAHFGQFLRICDDGEIHFEKEAYVKFSIAEYTKALKYHKLTNHLAAIRRDDNKLQEIKSRSSDFSCMGDEIIEKDPCKIEN
ncbi:MAG: lipase family protein [Sphingobacterium sp.]